MYTVETTKELDNMQFRFTGFKNHAFLSVSILLIIFTGALDTSKKKYTVDLSELGSCTGTNLIKFRSLDKYFCSNPMKQIKKSFFKICTEWIPSLNKSTNSIFSLCWYPMPL